MCDCIEKMNEALKPNNAMLGMALQITEGMGLRSRLCVAVEKIDKSKRKAPPTVVANYCPFCGKSLHKEASNALAQGPGGSSPGPAGATGYTSGEINAKYFEIRLDINLIDD